MLDKAGFALSIVPGITYLVITCCQIRASGGWHAFITSIVVGVENDIEKGVDIVERELE